MICKCKQAFLTQYHPVSALCIQFILNKRGPIDHHIFIVELTLRVKNLLKTTKTNTMSGQLGNLEAKVFNTAYQSKVTVAKEVSIWVAQATKAIFTLYTVGLLLSVTGAVAFFGSQMTRAMTSGKNFFLKLSFYSKILVQKLTKF